MARKTVNLPLPAKRNIEQVLQEFLAEQKRLLKPAVFSKYESVIDLFRSYLNGYAYEDLSPPFLTSTTTPKARTIGNSASSSGRKKSLRASGVFSATL